MTQQVSFLPWTDTPNINGPVAVVVTNFGVDVAWNINLRGGYHQDYIAASAVVVDNLANTSQLGVTMNGIVTNIPAAVRTTLPISADCSTMSVTGTQGSVSLQFFKNAADAPPDQPNYAGLISQAITAAIPTGAIWPFGGSVAPSGWLICDGSAVSRAVQAALFAVIGTAYGIGDGLTTFNLPDGRDRTFIGASPGGLGADRPTARALGATGGEESHALTTSELAAHNHGVTDPTHTHIISDPTHRHGFNPGMLANIVDLNVGGGNDLSPGSHGGQQLTLDQAASTGITNTNAATGITIQNTGNGTPHNTMMPFFTGTWIIKT